MDFILTMHSWWLLLYEGGLSEFANFMNSTIPELVIDLFNLTVNEDGSISGTGKAIYNLIVNVLSLIKISEGVTLANTDLFSLMFGVGVLFIIVIAIAKWLPSVDDVG